MANATTTTAPSYPLKFSGSTVVISNNVQLPPNALGRVIVSSADGCTSHIAPVREDGRFDVDFLLHASDPLGAVVDTLKFHFYAKADLLVASGCVPMGEFLRGVDRGGTTHFDATFNFVKNCVKVEVKGPPSPSAGLEAFLTHPPAPSALWGTDRATKLFSDLSTQVSDNLRTKLVISPEIGAPIFTHVLTAHAMEGQFTTHMHYQLDMEPTRRQTNLLLESGLTMMAVADTLHFWGRNADEVRGFEPVELTKFSAACCQFLQRSARVMPYVPDACVTADEGGNVTMRGTEVFKRFLSEPMDLELDTPLAKDDCEGYATAMHVMFRSFQHLYEDEKREPACPKPLLLLSRIFPPARFDMTDEQKQVILGLAMLIGEQASSGLIESCTTMVSAHAASLGAGLTAGLKGHVTQTMLSKHAALEGLRCLGAELGDTSLLHCENILMEGTNSIQAETKDFRMKIVSKSGHVTEIPFYDIANTISRAMSTGDKDHSRISIHMMQKGRMPFYTGVFCQGGNLVGMRTAEGDSLGYGLPVEMLSDQNSKVFMQVKSPEEDWLRGHIQARHTEIHPPFVTLEKLGAVLSKWSPVTYFPGVEELREKEITNCVVSEAFEDPTLRMKALDKALASAQSYNSKPGRVGYMAAWTSMDSVFKRVSLEHTPLLQESMQHALGHMLDEKEEQEQKPPPP